MESFSHNSHFFPTVMDKKAEYELLSANCHVCRQSRPCGRQRNFPFRKQAMPFLTVDAFSDNSRCHLYWSMSFPEAVDAIEYG